MSIKFNSLPILANNLYKLVSSVARITEAG